MTRLFSDYEAIVKRLDRCEKINMACSFGNNPPPSVWHQSMYEFLGQVRQANFELHSHAILLEGVLWMILGLPS
jgi:hypothetical protein